jgi:hypothetical protein
MDNHFREPAMTTVTAAGAPSSIPFPQNHVGNPITCGRL